MRDNMTREERRRAQRWAANFKFSVLVVVLVVLGILIGYTTAKAMEPEETIIILPARRIELPLPELVAVEQEPEPAAEEYATLEPLELIGDFTVTAYCPCVKCCGIWSAEHPERGGDYIQKTRSGTVPQEGRTIAADWDVLPCGEEVVINGHTYTVEDTGSAIKGNRIDLFFEDHQEALEWGVQEVGVYRER